MDEMKKEQKFDFCSFLNYFKDFKTLLASPK